MERAVLQTPLDRYVILEYLAEGGMGAIYLGKKLGMGGFEKEVVLKQLLPEFTEQPEFIDLFLREARLSASLDHANIVHTIDLVAAGNDFFIVMEYVKGGDLRTLLKRAKRRDKQWKPEASLFIGREILGALAYAHAKTGPESKPLNLIHRDVSPSNILLSHSGEVKLTDFGIAKANTHRSVFYKVKGKVGYMSPEQARGEPLDHRSDLYSGAVCLYEILTGERLFVGDLSMSPDQIYSQPVPRVSQKRRALPSDLDAVMAKALAVDPNQRFQTAVEFSDALLRVAHKHGLMCGAPDLAAHLRELCGDDVTTWMHIDEDEDEEESRPGTELLSSSGGGTGTGQSKLSHMSQLAGRELTSIIDSKNFVPRGASLTGLFTTIEQSRGGVNWSPVNADVKPEHFEDPTRHYPTESLKKRERQPKEASSPSSSEHRKSTTGAPRVHRPIERKRIVTGVLVAVAVGLGIAAAVGLTRPDLAQTIEDEPAPTKKIAAAAAAQAKKPEPKPVAKQETPPPPAPEEKPAPPPQPKKAEPPQQPEVHEAHGNAPPGRGVTLEISSQPAGGTVLLDGKPMCTTPCKIRDLSRDPVYVLKVAHEGFVSWSSIVDLRGRDGDRLYALLRPQPNGEIGWLSVRSNKVAGIYLNGREIGGVTNDGKIPLRPGKYDLQVVHPRFPTKPQAQVKVEKGATTSLNLAFK